MNTLLYFCSVVKLVLHSLARCDYIQRRCIYTGVGKMDAQCLALAHKISALEGKELQSVLLLMDLLDMLTFEEADMSVYEVKFCLTVLFKFFCNSQHARGELDVPSFGRVIQTLDVA